MKKILLLLIIGLQTKPSNLKKIYDFMHKIPKKIFNLKQNLNNFPQIQDNPINYFLKIYPSNNNNIINTNGFISKKKNKK